MLYKLEYVLISLFLRVKLSYVFGFQEKKQGKVENIFILFTLSQI